MLREQPWQPTSRSRTASARSHKRSSRPTRNAAPSTISGIRPLPSYREVVDLLADLREILYPGYGRRQNLHLGNVAYHVGDLIDGLHNRLTQQIARAFRYDCKANNGEADVEAKAQAIVIRFPGGDSRAAADAHRRRPGGVRRRPGRQEPGRDRLLLSRRGGDHRVPAGPRASSSRRALDSPDDDRVRPRQDRHRHPPRRRASAAASSSTTAPAS